MQKRKVEFYSDAVNANILRTPGRRFPALVIQGDSFYSIYAQAVSVLEAIKAKKDSEAATEVLDLCDELRHRLQHYEDTIKAEGFDVPYGWPLAENKVLTAHRWPPPDDQEEKA